MELPPPTTKLIDSHRESKPMLISGGRRPIQPGGSYGSNQLQKGEKSTAIIAGWVLLFVGYLLAAIPLLGLLIWMIGFLFCGAAGILGIIGAAKGKPIGGVVLICASIASFFLYLAMPFIVVGILAAGQE
jgi:hypothetical protein